MQRQLSTTIALLLAMAAAPAFAGPKLTMDMKAEKDVVVVENGKQVTKRVEAKSQLPGELVIYTFIYNNVGDAVATQVSIPNKIPEGTTYVGNSAKGDVAALFSIDSGKTFAAPEQLKFEVINANNVKEMVVAPPEKYTDIRWVIPQVPAGKSGQTSYMVRLK